MKAGAMKTGMLNDTLPTPSAVSAETLVMPVSRAQQLIWLRSRHNQNAAAWNVAVRFMLNGDLRPSVFRAAVARVVSANEILRTSFTEHDGVVSQVIPSSVVVPVSILDLSLLSADEQQRVLDERSRAEARRPFSLIAAPLLRVRLIRLEPQAHVLLLTLHHAITDGWSIGLISDALMQAYEDELAADPHTPDLGLQYADYCVWQSERRESSDYQQHASFWTSYLAGIPKAASPAATPSSSEAAITSVVLPVSLTDRIAALARQRGVTFSQVAASAFAVLRASQTNQATVIFGAPVPGRDSTELESIIGPFVNYLPVRAECAPDTQLSELLKSTSAMFAEWISHSEYRYADILRALHRETDLLDPFDALFISQRDFVRTVERGGLTLSALPSVSPGALYGMTFFLVERADGWRASCEVDTAQYSVDQAKRLLENYQQILTAFAETPDHTIGSVIAQLQQSASADPALALVGPAFAATAGDQPASFVDFPASEAQARYYLLDHSDPGKSTFHLRIRLTVDGPLQLNLVTETLNILIHRHEILRTTFVMLDEKLCQRVHEPTLAPSFESSDLSSLTATDREEHLRLALLREDDWHFDFGTGPLFRVFAADLGQGQWILAFTLAHLLVDGWSCSILQNEFQKIYTSLLHSARPEVPELTVQYADYAVSEEQWLQSAEVERRVDFWRERLSGKLAALDLPADIATDRTSKSNGAFACATMDASLAASVRSLARDLETTPFVIYAAVFQALLHRYSAETDIIFSTPLASRTDETENVMGPFSIPVLLRTQLNPHWSLRQYIQALHHIAMDSFDKPLPFEKYADSIALSIVRGRHALNQICFFYQKAFVEASELNGMRFTPFPTAVTGAAFDWQLAIIERQHGIITAECQYDADLYSSETMQLAVRHYERLLSETLFHLDAPISEISFATPEELDAAATHPHVLLPISKRCLGIDKPRRVDPSVQDAHDEEQMAAVLPRNEEESVMAILWQRAFRRSPISTHANFFDLGGHSLTLARLQALCQKELGRRIHASDLFAAPTIVSLTARLNGTATTAAPINPRLIPLQATGTQPPLFLISQSMVFRRVAECLGADQPVFTVQIEDGDLKGSESFEQFARFYVNIIREAQPHGPYRLGGWCAAAWVAYEVAQQLRALGETVEMLLIVDAWAPGYWRDLPIGRKLIAKTNYRWARLQWQRRVLTALPFREQAVFLRERARLCKAAIVRQMGSVPLLRRFIRQVVADSEITLVDQVQFAASLKYQARPWPGNAVLFRSAEQPAGKFLPDDMGWAQVLTEPSAITFLPGDHRRIFEDPGAQTIARSVKAFLSGNPGNESHPANPADEKSNPVPAEVQNRSCALIGF